MFSTLILAAHGYEAEIAPERGANLLRLSRPALGMDALRTPRCSEDMTEGNPYLWGTPLLFPPNRISGARFSFQGRAYRWPLNEPATGCFLHGTLHAAPFDVERHEKNVAELVFRATPGSHYLSFPHAFTLRMRCTLSESGVEQRVSFRNDSDADMPIALGFHTTFRIPFVQGGRAESVRLRLSCGREILRDTDFLPTGEMLRDYPERAAYAAEGLDACVRTLSRHYEMAPPRTAVLRDADSGASIVYRMSAPFRYWMLYNGGSRDFLCVEPQTWMNNCPNAPFPREETGFDFLPPGQEKIYRCHFRLERP